MDVGEAGVLALYLARCGKGMHACSRWRTDMDKHRSLLCVYSQHSQRGEAKASWVEDCIQRLVCRYVHIDMDRGDVLYLFTPQVRYREVR